VWALDAGSSGSPLTLTLALAGAASVALLAALGGAMALRGRARAIALGILWALAATATLTLVFGRPGGDSLTNLAAHSALRAEHGHLFVGGEFLGHLWFAPWGATHPMDRGASLLMGARVAGWGGLAGLLACAALLAAPARAAVDRGALAAAACGVPYVVLLAGYPQSTALMSALVPLYLATSIAALRDSGRRRFWAAAAGALLALACSAHGSAYWLGLGALSLVIRWLRGGDRRAALLFCLVFAVLWSTATAAEWSLIHRSRTMPWSFLSAAFDLGGLGSSFGGPLDLSRPWTAASWWTATGELWRWAGSLVPLAALGALAAPLLWWQGRRNSDRTPATGFLALSAVGALALWASWNTWYGYPADWDVTAIAALTLQLTAVSLLVRGGPSPLRQALLGAALPLQLTMTFELAAQFTGWAA
jgi:hypothetical protein